MKSSGARVSYLVGQISLFIIKISPTSLIYRINILGIYIETESALPAQSIRPKRVAVALRESGANDKYKCEFQEKRSSLD